MSGSESSVEVQSGESSPEMHALALRREAERRAVTHELTDSRTDISKGVPNRGSVDLQRHGTHSSLNEIDEGKVKDLRARFDEKKYGSESGPGVRTRQAAARSAAAAAAAAGTGDVTGDVTK